MLSDFGTEVPGELGMPNQLSMASIQSIETLHRSGHSNREIALILGIDRGAVNKYVRRLRTAEAPPAMPEAGSEDSQNRPNLRTGSGGEVPGSEASQLHLRPVPLCRRVIQSEFDELTHMTDGTLADSDMQQLFGDVLYPAAQCLQKVVVILQVTRNTGSAEPARHHCATPPSSIPRMIVKNISRFFGPERW